MRVDWLKWKRYTAHSESVTKEVAQMTGCRRHIVQYGNPADKTLVPAADEKNTVLEVSLSFDRKTSGVRGSVPKDCSRKLACKLTTWSCIRAYTREMS